MAGIWPSGGGEGVGCPCVLSKVCISGLFCLHVGPCRA